jgi:WNK lysine deficient protein kinase
MDEETEAELPESKEKIVERSPKQRFIRVRPIQFNEELGNGAYKRVYRGYDSHTGCEIAWNVIKVHGMAASERRRITEEINLIKTLQHPHIIHFISAWVNRAKEEVVFITEIVTGGSLKSYLKRIRNPKLKVIKQWCREILSGLEYLHGQQPNPIVHRDLKCDNIFIMANTGQIRIADLGLSTTMSRSHVTSVVGTPEYMAPEVFNERYGPKVDIYAFGMSVLEMCTLTPPYRECLNPASVFRKVMDGIKPQSLDLIEDQVVRGFISTCIANIDVRPSATELLSHPFLVIDEADERNNEAVALKSKPKPADSAGYPLRSHGVPQPLKVLNLSLILQREGCQDHIEFEYRVDKDRPETVAKELVDELMLDPSAFNAVTKEIETLVKRSLKPDMPTIFQESSNPFKLTREDSKSKLASKTAKRSREDDIEQGSRSSQKSSANESYEIPAPSQSLVEPESPSKSNYSAFETSGKKSRISDSSSNAERRPIVPCLSNVMRRGQENNLKSEVETLQLALNEVLGIKLRIDGVFSRKTEASVKQFQDAQGLEVDGIVTHDLWDRLMSNLYAVERERLVS